MSFRKWLADFQSLHAKAKDGKLGPRERDAYQTARDEFATALLAAQQLTLKPGETARNALRVARSLQLDLELSAGPHRTPTIDLSLGGFSALLAGNAVKRDETVRYALRLPAGEPISGRALVVQTAQHQGNARVSFAFEKLSEEYRARLEFVILDAAIDAISRGK